MAPKIFLTGVTGYIGGDIFYALHEAHPEYEYALLVRTEERGKPVAAKYPKARLVYGTLDDADVIEKEAAAADIVIHTAESADNIPSARAIAKGLAAGHSADQPGYWLHICGTGILQWYDEAHARFGEPPLPEQRYSDVADIERILAFPDQALHRAVDKVVLAANAAPGVRTAIVGPPTIYGAGRGPGNRVSQQVPGMAAYMLRQGYAPVIGPPGRTEWDNVHVADVAWIMVALAEAAQDPARKTDPQLFGDHAYYFLEREAHRWADVARWVAEAAYKQGFMAEPKTEMVSMEEVCRVLGAKTSSWGTNSKSVAERARKYLGWEPRGESLEETIAEVVKGEAERLGIKPTGHTH